MLFNKLWNVILMNYAKRNATNLTLCKNEVQEEKKNGHTYKHIKPWKQSEKKIYLEEEKENKIEREFNRQNKVTSKAFRPTMMVMIMVTMTMTTSNRKGKWKKHSNEVVDSIARYRFQLTFNCKHVCCLDQSEAIWLKTRNKVPLCQSTLYSLAIHSLSFSSSEWSKNNHVFYGWCEMESRMKVNAQRAMLSFVNCSAFGFVNEM